MHTMNNAIIIIKYKLTSDSGFTSEAIIKHNNANNAQCMNIHKHKLFDDSSFTSEAIIEHNNANNAQCMNIHKA